MINLSIKCKGLHCLKKETCQRFTAPANPAGQQYFARIPITGDVCRFYVAVSADQPKPENKHPKPERKPALKKEGKKRKNVKKQNKAK